MKNKFILIMPILIFLIGMVSGTYYVANPTSCLSNDQTNYPGQYCDPQDICGIISGNVQCYDTSLISPPVSSSTTTGAGGTDYTCIGTACSGGFITDCYAATNCLTALCDRNATCYNKHTQTTCNSGSWISSSCSATCTTNYFACDSNTTDANGCEINAGASCGGGTGTIVLNQCYSASAGNCTSASRLDCNNDDSDSNPATCNGADGCEILIGGACSVGGLIGTYGATCTGSSGTCVLSKKNFVTGNNTQYSTNASETFLWGKDYGVGNLVNLTSNNNNSFIIDNQTNVIANNSNFSIGNKITMSLGIILEAITSTWAKITGSLWVTGNLNATGTGTFQNITVLGDKLCNTVNCFTLGELNTTGSGGNASWNQSFADTLYYGISNPSNFINSTYNSTYAGYGTFNTTLNIQNLYNSTMTNYVGTINSTLNIQNLYNSTALMYANLANVTGAQAMTINSTLNIQNLYNVTASMIANLSISQSTNSGNASWNQSFANTLYYGISNPSGFFNASNYSSYNATYASYGTFNSTLNIQNLYNATALMYAQLANVTGAQAMTINSTLNIQQLFNSTMTNYVGTINSTLNIQNLYNSTALMYANLANVTAAQAMTINSTLNIQNLFNVTASMIANLSISQSTNSGNASWNQSFANTLYYGISNPSNFINSTYNSTYASYGTFNTTLNIKALLAGTNISQYAFNQTMSLLTMQNLYNSTALMYANLANVTATLALTMNDTGNAQILINNTNIYLSSLGIGTSTPNSTLSVIGNVSVSGNLSANYFLGNGQYLTGIQTYNSSYANYATNVSTNWTAVTFTTYNSTWNQLAQISALSSNVSSVNTTLNIQNLYNSTALMYANLANVTAAQAMTINSTLNIQNLYNSTMTNYVGTINNTLNIQNLYNSTVIQLINLANNTYANQVLMNSTISMIANLTFLQNFTTAAVQALVNSSYVFRGSANQTSVSCSNITGNATDLCTITSSGSGPKNTTAEIGALYNSTVIQLINLANNTYANQVLMNSTISMIANLSISQSASGKNYWGSNGSNIYNLTALIGIGTSSPDSLLTIGNSANALNVSGELYVNSSGISIGDPSISNALSLKGATGGAIVEFGSQGDWPTDSYPLGTNLYFVLDKNGNTADTSIVLRDQGATRSEIGLISDDNFHIKSVSGTYSNETFLDRMIIYNGNSSQGISNNANNVNGTIDFFGNQTLGNSKAGELLRLYPSSTSSSQNWFISGNSNTTDGWGLEMGFDFGTATSYINSIKHGSTYVPILFSVQNFTIATGTGSVTNNLIVTSAGNVGIGTTNPAFLLQTGISTGGADVNLSGMLYINTSDQDVGIQTFNPRSDLDVWGNFSTNSSFFINGAGSVGIGTLAPSKTLDVRGQGNFSGVIWYNNNTRVNITITNSTINTQMLYNATALLFAQMVNSTAVHQMLLNNTNVGFLQVNATQIVVTGGGNVTVAGNISAGWETITGTCAAGGTFCNASCTTGKTIMGGGCWGGALNASYPFNRTTWYCSTNSSTVVTKTVYAICGRFS